MAAFHTRTEAAHEVARWGEATVFPQPVGLGATWNPDLLTAIGEVEGRDLTSSVLRRRVLHEYDLPVFTQTLNLAWS